MPGPIASAFVEIRARLSLDPNSDFEKQLRSQVRGIETQLEKLEGAAREAGGTIERQLRNVRLDLNVREALTDLERLDEAANDVTAELRQIQSEDIGLTSTSARRNIVDLEKALD